MNGFENATVYGKDFVDGMLKSVAASTKGFQAIATEAADYSKASFEKGSAALEDMIASKSVEKALEIQVAYAKESYEGFVAEMTKMGEMYTEMAKDAYKPFETMVAKAK